MTTCPSAWTPAPADATAPFSSACYKASGYAISLRECVERCALDGAAPVCARATHLESLVVASADGTRAATDRLEAKVDRLQATLDRLMSEGIQSVAVARTTADDVLSA